VKRESVNITGEYVSETIRSYQKMAEPVMAPVMILLIGGLLIAAGILLASRLAPWVGIILAIAGVATLLVGMIMLFGLAHAKNKTK
jgi:ABC-type multidrug transport system permease subunit